MVIRVDEIRTERLLMRRWREDDREPRAAMNADPEVMRYFESVLTRDESDSGIDRYEALFAASGVGPWALERLDNGEFIGHTGLAPMPAGGPGDRHYEIGWRLTQRSWHHGYATEAARAALAAAFDQVAVDEVWSLTAVQNMASIAVMLRLGLRHITTEPHPNLAADSPLSQHVYYRITADEYRGIKSC